jgi:hypothetical protein
MRRQDLIFSWSESLPTRTVAFIARVPERDRVGRSVFWRSIRAISERVEAGPVEGAEGRAEEDPRSLGRRARENARGIEVSSEKIGVCPHFAMKRGGGSGGYRAAATDRRKVSGMRLSFLCWPREPPPDLTSGESALGLPGDPGSADQPEKLPVRAERNDFQISIGDRSRRDDTSCTHTTYDRTRKCVLFSAVRVTDCGRQEELTPAIDALPVLDLRDRHDRSRLVDLVDDAVLAYPKPVEILEPLEFFRPERSRVVSQGENHRVGAFENFPR